jgi:hypothetical protein
VEAVDGAALEAEEEEEAAEEDGAEGAAAALLVVASAAEMCVSCGDLVSRACRVCSLWSVVWWCCELSWATQMGISQQTKHKIKKERKKEVKEGKRGRGEERGSTAKAPPQQNT